MQKELTCPADGRIERILGSDVLVATDVKDIKVRMDVLPLYFCWLRKVLSRPNQSLLISLGWRRVTLSKLSGFECPGRKRARAS